MPIEAGLNDPNSFYTGADNANKLMQSFALKKAGAQLSAGDQPGAVTSLNNAGMLDEASNVQQHQQAIAEHARAFQTKMISDISTSLDSVGTQYGWDKVLPAFDKMVPLFKQQGATDEQLQQIRAAIASDPQSSVRMFSANAQKEMEQYTLNPGAIRYDANGHVIARGNSRYQALGENQSLVQTDGQGAPAEGGAATTGVDGGTLPLPGLEDGTADPNAVQTVESGGRSDAVSPKGAVGSMQTMPNTLANPGFGVKPAQPGPDGKIPPEEMARVGREYLPALSQHFHSPVLGLIAYNWGPGKTERWIAQGAQMQKLPPGVKTYLADVLIAHARGLPMPPPPAQHPEDDAMAHRVPFQQSNLPSGGPQVVVQGKPSWRPLTDAEAKKYPGADGFTPKGPHYPPAAAMQSQGVPTDEEMKVHAQTYLITGQMPPAGMNNATVRNKIMALSADEAKRHGWNGADVANLRAQYKADSTSLSKMQTLRSQIGAYEETVQGSMNMVKEFAPKAMANTGYQTSNKAYNWWKRETNDPDMLSLDNAVGTVIQEYAKVMVNATGGGVTSDQARNRAEALVNQAGDTKSLLAQINVLKREMDIRVNSMDKGMGQLNAHMHMMLSDPQHATTVAKSLAKPTKQGHWDPAQGKVVWQ